MTLRTMAEGYTHHFVFRRKLAPPFQQIRLYVSSEAGLRYLKPRLGNVDPNLLRWVLEYVHPGHTVWDIGANIGLFALTAANRAGPTGRVLAVEADGWNVGLLRRSAALRQPSSAVVEVLAAALSDRVGVARFHIALRNRATNHLEGAGSTIHTKGGIRETQVVPTVTLDHLLGYFPAPDVLKIDVEGAEVAALGAASRVLAHHPLIICEVYRENSAAIRDLLAPCGYIFYDGEQNAARGPVSHPPYSTLAIHEPTADDLRHSVPSA